MDHSEQCLQHGGSYNQSGITYLSSSILCFASVLWRARFSRSNWKYKEIFATVSLRFLIREWELPLDSEGGAFAVLGTETPFPRVFQSWEEPVISGYFAFGCMEGSQDCKSHRESSLIVWPQTENVRSSVMHKSIPSLPPGQEVSLDTLPIFQLQLKPNTLFPC